MSVSLMLTVTHFNITNDDQQKVFKSILIILILITQIAVNIFTLKTHKRPYGNAFIIVSVRFSSKNRALIACVMKNVNAITITRFSLIKRYGS